MSYYMTNVIISPTLYEEKRLEAISYFSRCQIKAKCYSSSYNRG